MKKIIALIIILACVYSQEYIMSDYDYTNQDFTFQETLKFVKSYPNNKLTYSEIEIVFRYCVIYKINIMAAFARMQLESDLLWNNTKKKYEWRKSRSMGYGAFHNFRKDGLKFYKYGNYDIQVYFSIKTMRKLFDEWTPNTQKEVLDLKKWITPENAATYALLRYNPFYGEHNEYNWEESAIGNKAFESLIPKLKKQWEKIND